MRKTIIIISMLLPGLWASAKVLSPQEAWSRLQGPERSRLHTCATSAPTVTINGETGPTLYLFATGGKGMAVVSADDCAAPLLGYSEAGIDADGKIPCGLEAMLDCYARQIDAARLSGTASSFKMEKAAEDDRPPLPVALSTKWGQSAPFNNFCPTDAGGKCVVGCVATAMAQVLNFYKQPVTGSGAHSYTWNYVDQEQGLVDEQIDMDFSSMTFDWDNMLDDYKGEYTEEQAKAVAELSYACGVAVDMMYGSAASGTQQGRVPYAFWQYFGFNPGNRLVDRDCFRVTEMSWDDYVYSQLARHGAVLYCGVTSANEGHAFVCDGYDGDGFFHFNWGWFGLSDGWYRLSALNPQVQGTGGSSKNLSFNFYQNIVADLDPDGAGEYLPNIIGRDKAFATTNKTVKLGSKFTVTGYILNSTQLDYKLEFGCLFTDSTEGTEGEVLKVCDFDLPSCMDKTIFNKVTIPADFAEGRYCVRPVVKWEGLDYWWTLPWWQPNDHFWADVKDGIVQFSKEAGVAQIYAEPEDTPEYFNLQGVRIDNPEKGGIYIHKTTQTTTKIIR